MNATIREGLEWIAVDWGSSNLRAWALDRHGEVLARGSSQRGMLGLTAERYEAALLEVVADWLSDDDAPVDVMVCGMAGARQGWQEAPYRQVPCRLESLVDGAVSPPTLRESRLHVSLLPGLCQPRGREDVDFDVMRGEETQLAGLAALEPALSGWACLPGTHSKWARLESGTLDSFRTYLTGELYRLLAERSVLAHSVGEDSLDDPDCRGTFLAAIDDAVERPARVTQWLFGIRAIDLLDYGLPSDESRGRLLAARLSGLIIGLELGAVRQDLADGEAVSLIGAESLCRRYAVALEALGYPSRTLDSERVVLAGLRQARHALHS
ncbi:2-dehydro-3-deoxygalactonokinase [Litchfieldella xinjiangensis]|uniref:2-dehydro-3-deoxygalactonokinase n=1 Tax=Litchfieldella xinjiangensis TaxID=1166948 RepID=UPI0005BCD093|nr:2-dehydro-3-deoxygalactonokinase [Halomonas xinjiangensis]